MAPSELSKGTALRSGRQIQSPSRNENTERLFRETTGVTSINPRLSPNSKCTLPNTSQAHLDEMEVEDTHAEVLSPENSSNTIEEGRNEAPYPNHANDPDQIPKTLNEKDAAAHSKYFREYSQGILSAYARTTILGAIFWQESITSFRPHTIRHWKRPMIKEWRDLLVKRGIFSRHRQKAAPYRIHN